MTQLTIILLSLMIDVPGWTPPPEGVWKPPPKSIEILSRAEDEVSAGGSRGGMKTESGLMWMIEPEYVQHPRYKGLMLRIQRKDLKECWERSKYLYASTKARFVGDPEKGSATIKFPAGGYIVYGHLKDESAYEQYVGPEFQKVNFEQIDECPSEELYLKVLACNRSSIQDLKAQTYVSWNPGGVGHAWVVDRFYNKAYNKTYWYDFEIKLPDGRVIRSKKSRIHIPTFVWDNPYTDPSYLSTLNQLPDKWKRAWLYGDVNVFMGQYFDGFREIGTKPFNSIKSHDPVYVYAGCDWGRKDAASSHLIAVNSQGKHTVFSEVYVTGQTPQQFGELMNIQREGIPVLKTFADRSIWNMDQYGREIHAVGEVVDFVEPTIHSIANQIETDGPRLTQANRDRMARWMRMQTLMQQGKFEVMSCCPKLIGELKSAIFNRKPSLTNKRSKDDIDPSCSDHALDDVGYCCLHTRDYPLPEYPKSMVQQEMDRIARKNSGIDNTARSMGIGMDAHGGV